MLATLFNKKSKNSEINYSILSQQDTRRIKKCMETAKIERTETFNETEIESVTILWSGAAVLIKTPPPRSPPHNSFCLGQHASG